MNIREILVATDFSDNAGVAVQAARGHARRFGARLHILHAAWSDDPESAERLARVRDGLGAGGPVVVATAFGDPAHEITRYAREHAIDLIVVGTHGRTGISRALLGSVAERVIRTAPCPVLAVPLIAATPAPAPEAVAAAPVAPSHCVVCAALSPDLICEACRVRIRGEVLRRKLEDERAGRTTT